MKKLSLMMVLVLALGIVGVACSDDDAAVTSTKFVNGNDGSAAFFSNNTFTVINFSDDAMTLMTQGWKGTYADSKDGYAACTVNSWLSNSTLTGTGKTNEDWTPTSNGLNSFTFTYTTNATATNILSADSITLTLNSSVWTKVTQ